MILCFTIRVQMLIEDIQMVEINKIPVFDKYIDLHSLDQTVFEVLDKKKIAAFPSNIIKPIF